MRNNCSRNDVTYAGFWVRLAAYLIDSVLVFFGLLAVRLVLSGILSFADGTALGGNLLFDYTLKDIVLYVCQVCYFILFTYCAGTTPGKKLMNLRVVSAEGGGGLTFFNVLYRETVGRFLCGLSIGIGYIVAGIDREKRGIHDMLCDTRVIYAKKVKVYPAYPAPPAGNPGGQQMPPQVPPLQVTPQGQPPVPPVQQMPPRGQDVHNGGAYRMVPPGEETQERNPQERNPQE